MSEGLKISLTRVLLFLWAIIRLRRYIRLLRGFYEFQFGFVAKEDLGRLPFYGKWIGKIRSVFIERGDHRSSLKAINKGIEYIEQGFSLLFSRREREARALFPAHFREELLSLLPSRRFPIIPVSLQRQLQNV